MQKLTKQFMLWVISGFAALLIFSPVAAHGTTIDVTVDGRQVEILAQFETGEPMADAQILVYPPNDPQNAWHTGISDENGRYVFDMDTTEVGEWAISIRSGGHGQIIYLDVASDGTIITRFGEEQHRDSALWMASIVIAILGGIAYWFSRPRPSVIEPIPGEPLTSKNG